MAILGQEQDTAESLAQDGRKAIRMGKNAARTAKTVSKAATQAASGNVAGAVVTVAKDPETMKKILLIVLLPILVFAMLSVFFLYALPTAIFEAICSFADQMKEDWDVAQLENPGGAISAFIQMSLKISKDAIGALGDAVKNLVDNAWSAVKSFFFGNDEEKNQTEDISDDASEITIVSQEASEKLAMVKKAIAVNKKYDIRANQIKDAIDGKANSIYNAGGTSINQSFYERFCGEDESWHGTTLRCAVEQMGTVDPNAVTSLQTKLEEMQNVTSTEELTEKNEEFNTMINSLFPVVEDNGGANSEALGLMSLLTVQQGASTSNMKMSDFIKYVGYYKKADGKNISMDVGHAASPFTVNLQSWRGTFKPQYLMEEYNYYLSQLNLEKTKLGGNDDEAVQEKIAELEDKINMYENSGMPLIDLLMYLDIPDFDCNGSCITEHCSYGDGGTSYIYKSTSGETQLAINHWSVTDRLGNVTYHANCEITAKVMPRGTSNVAYLIGLWSGGLDDAQSNTYIPPDERAA